MTLVACGVNHTTAPIALREQLAVTPDKQAIWLDDLLAEPSVREATILSTCNRTELYCHADDTAALLPWLSRHGDVSPDTLAPHIYWHHDTDAAKHAIRVACGLDSMMLGEPQIFGQMKQAYHQALDTGAIGPQLRNLFRHVFSASKRIRTNTGIGINPVSIAFAGVNLIAQHITDLSTAKVMLIGAGDTTKLVGKYLQDAGCKDFYIANRTTQNAQTLAELLQGKSLGIGDIPEQLPYADVVVSATACPLPFITENMVSKALEARKQTPMVFIDLAVPRDIEAEVGNLQAVSLYNVDDCQSLITENLEKRRDCAKQAEQIIEFETQNYLHWQRSQRANRTISLYREQMATLSQQEITRAKRLLAMGKDTETVMNELTQRLTNKIIHNPTVKLKAAGYQNHEDYLQLIDYLYRPEDL